MTSPLRTFLSCILTLFLASPFQAQVLTDSTIAQIAFWQIGDEAVYTFEQTEENFEEGQLSKVVTTYEVQMVIIDSTANSYTVQWNYSNYQVDPPLSPKEREFYDICEQIPVVYQTDAFGRFQGIVNWKEMQQAARQAINQRFAGEADIPDSPKQFVTQLVMSLFQNQQQASYWANDIRFFHHLYGVNLLRDKPNMGVRYFTTPLMETQIAGEQKITVESVDEEQWIAHLKAISGIEGEAARSLMYDFLLRNMEKFNIQNEEEIVREDIPALTIKEELDCIYHIPSGYIIQGRNAKRTEMAGQYKQTTYAYQLKQ
jgi:hypothetical protein